MKLIKRIFMGISALLVLLCIAVAVLAFNPSLSDSLAKLLYGNGESQEETDAGAVSGEAETDAGAGAASGEAEMDAGAGAASGEAKTDAGAGAASGEAKTDAGAGAASGEDKLNEGGSAAGEQEPGGADGNLPDGAKGSGQEIVASLPEGSRYHQPQESAVSTPANVTGKTGYIPVQGDAQQIGDSETQSGQADIGETGGDLIFDAEFYPYYGMLNETLQKLYRQIYANAMALNQTFRPVEEVSFRSLKTVFEAVYNDHPELFWLETGYSCKYQKDGRCVEIALQFNETAENLETEKKTFENAAARLLVAARGKSGAYEQEKAVHNALLEHVKYNIASPMNQSAYSALVGGQTVCAGYARAFQYLMQQLGIPCYYCTGWSGQNHAWNIVKLDDGYYNVDATWDDTAPATYDYFNKSDADFADTHMRNGLSVYLPACAGEAYRNLESESPQLAGQENSGSEGSGAEHKDSEGSVTQTENALKTLEYYGLKEEDVVKDMSSYYKECSDFLIHGGTGTVEFNCAIPEELWDAVETAYATRAYEKGYVENVLKELGANSCYFEIEGVQLQDGYYLLKHKVTLQ